MTDFRSIHLTTNIIAAKVRILELGRPKLKSIHCFGVCSRFTLLSCFYTVLVTSTDMESLLTTCEVVVIDGFFFPSLFDVYS